MRSGLQVLDLAVSFGHFERQISHLLLAGGEGGLQGMYARFLGGNLDLETRLGHAELAFFVVVGDHLFFVVLGLGKQVVQALGL